MFNWFKKKEVDTDLLIDIGLKYLPAVAAVAETLKVNPLVDDILGSSELEYDHVHSIWHALNITIAHAAAREAIPRPDNENYIKACFSLIHSYPSLVAKIYPKAPAFSYEVFLDRLTTMKSYQKAHTRLADDFVMDAEVWDLRKSNNPRFWNVLDQMYKLNREAFAHIYSEVSRL